LEQHAFQQSQPFLSWLEHWVEQLPELSIDQAIQNPENTAILSVDVINGFCYEGPLASPRVRAIIAPIVDLFEAAWEKGVRHIILTQDTHEPDAIEFGQFPPHCVRGMPESQPVPEFKALPFFDRLIILEKNSINSAINSGLAEWVFAHPEVDTYIVVGDCTDLCTYQLAMYLRLNANECQLQRRVIVPADTADTYDLPVEAAQSVGALPHDANLLHAIFLYHMALNGVEVVQKIY
jgi:nicotinamidase-related amidase